MPVTASVTAVLDLQAGVDLEEVERVPGRVDEELDRARRPVVDRPRQARGPPRAGRPAAASARPGAGASSTTFWLRRCSEQSRSPRTDDAARPSPNDLHLDVAGPGDEALEEHARPSRSWRLPARVTRAQASASSSGPSHARHADAAAAGGRLEQHRVADRRGRGGRRRRGRRAAPVPGSSGTPGGSGAARGRVSLSPNALDLRRASGPTNARPAASTAAANVGVLGQEPVAGVDRVGAGVERGLDDAVGRAGSSSRGGRGAERAPPSSAMAHVRRRRGRRRSSTATERDAEPPQRADDPARRSRRGWRRGRADRAAGRSRGRSGAARVTIMRTGVGSKPLQGLLICGQFDTTTSTSISARSSTYLPGAEMPSTMPSVPSGSTGHVHEPVDVATHVALAQPVARRRPARKFSTQACWCLVWCP